MEGSTERRGLWLREVWASTVGKKVIVAISGVILASYVVLHVLGNLKVFQGTGGGDPAIDGYARFLRTAGAPVVPHQGLLWTVRAVLLLALLLHLTGIYQLWLRNRAARPPARPPHARPDPAHARFADDDADRGADPRLPRLPHPPVHDSDDPGDAGPAGRGLRQPLRGLPEVVLRGALRRCGDAARAAPAPRASNP